MAPSRREKMRIWHQSFTDLTKFPRYRNTLEEHAAKVSAADMSIAIHGLIPGTYPPGIAPMEVNSHAGLRSLNARQVCEAALAAQKNGYDAFALGCFFDPGLQEARSLVDIPVLSLTESTMLTACSLGRRFALISLTSFQKMLTEELAAQYGLSSRLAGVIAMSPSVSLHDLEREGDAVQAIKAGFMQACSQALDLGAEIIIPGDGVLNAFLVRHRLLNLDGAPVMDALGVLFHHAAFFVRARRSECLDISRRLLYAQPTAAMLAHARAFYGALDRGESEFS